MAPIYSKETSIGGKNIGIATRTAVATSIPILHEAIQIGKLR